MFPTFWLLWIMLLWTFIYKSLYKPYVFSLWGIHLGVESLGLIAPMWEHAKLFSTVVRPFSVPTSNTWGFQFPCILADRLLSFWLEPCFWVWSSISLLLWFAFPWWLTILSCHMLIGHLYIFYGEMSTLIICPILNCVICLCIVTL